MKLDLKLLAENLSHAKEGIDIPRNGANDYLIDRILYPCMNGADIYLKDIDFSVFDEDDVETLDEFYNKLKRPACEARMLLASVGGILPAAANSRGFC